MRHLHAALLIAAGLLMTGPMPAGAAGTDSCVRELARTENTLVKTLLRVHGAAQAKVEQRCALYRDQAAAVTKARDVFARCMTGPTRDTEVTQLEGALSDANTMIGRTCTAQ